MEQIKEQKMVPYVGDFCPYLEEDESIEGVKARSGLLISKTPSYEPVKITRLKNEKVIVHYLD